MNLRHATLSSSDQNAMSSDASSHSGDSSANTEILTKAGGARQPDKSGDPSNHVAGDTERKESEEGQEETPDAPAPSPVSEFVDVSKIPSATNEDSITVPFKNVHDYLSFRVFDKVGCIDGYEEYDSDNRYQWTFANQNDQNSISILPITSENEEGACVDLVVTHDSLAPEMDSLVLNDGDAEARILRVPIEISGNDIVDVLIFRGRECEGGVKAHKLSELKAVTLISEDVNHLSFKARDLAGNLSSCIDRTITHIVESDEKLLINFGDMLTGGETVALNPIAHGFEEMKISNGSGCSGGNWEPLRDRIWTLTAPGLNVISARYRTSSSTSECVEASIEWEKGRVYHMFAQNLSQQFINHVAADPKNPNILMAVTKSQVVYKSMNGGVSWHVQCYLGRSFVINKVIRPIDGIASSSVISRDSGRFFTLDLDRRTGLCQSFDYPDQLHSNFTTPFSRASNGDIYFVSNDSIFKSSDQLASWQKLYTVPKSIQLKGWLSRVVVDSADENRLLIFSNESVYETVYEYKVKENSFRKMIALGNTSSAFTEKKLLFHPQKKERIYLADSNYFSENGGYSWTKGENLNYLEIDERGWVYKLVKVGSSVYLTMTQDLLGENKWSIVRQFENAKIFKPSVTVSGDKIIVFNDGRLWVSDDSGASFRESRLPTDVGHVFSRSMAVVDNTVYMTHFTDVLKTKKDGFVVEDSRNFKKHAHEVNLENHIRIETQGKQSKRLSIYFSRLNSTYSSYYYSSDLNFTNESLGPFPKLRSWGVGHVRDPVDADKVGFVANSTVSISTDAGNTFSLSSARGDHWFIWKPLDVSYFSPWSNKIIYIDKRFDLVSYDFDSNEASKIDVDPGIRIAASRFYKKDGVPALRVLTYGAEVFETVNGKDFERVGKKSDLLLNFRRRSMLKISEKNPDVMVVASYLQSALFAYTKDGGNTWIEGSFKNDFLRCNAYDIEFLDDRILFSCFLNPNVIFDL